MQLEFNSPLKEGVKYLSYTHSQYPITLNLMRKIFFILSSFVFLLSCQSKKETSFDFITTFEKSNGLETPTYQEVITFYKNLGISTLKLFSFLYVIDLFFSIPYLLILIQSKVISKV